MAKAFTGIVGDRESFDNRPNQGLKKLKELRKQPMDDSPTHPVWIISRLPQSCSISYGGEFIMVPARCPHGQCYVPNSRMLGKLPSGVLTVPADDQN